MVELVKILVALHDEFEPVHHRHVPVDECDVGGTVLDDVREGFLSYLPDTNPAPCNCSRLQPPLHINVVARGLNAIIAS